MNRFILAEEGTVLFRMSNRAEYYNEDKGLFEVRYNRTKARFFHTFFEAFLFYYTVEGEAEFWDKTHKPELIENKIKLHLN